MLTTKKIRAIVFSFSRFNRNLRFSSSASKPKAAAVQTSLYDFHLNHGGKMVNFSGYLLPLQYSDQSISSSHVHTRNHASIFDVSHMVQSYIRGKDAMTCLESLCTADIKGMAKGTASLTVFTNDNGGILDDLIVSKVNEKLLYVVSNATMRKQDIIIMKNAEKRFRAEGKDVNIEFLSTESQSLIAVQGPEAIITLKLLLSKFNTLDKLYFMSTTVCEIAGVPNCRITRCGYTGEDGVEVSVPSDRIKHIVEALLEVNKNIRMAGLGARDSLRLEAGLCLYGSDINNRTTPVEAGLAWILAHRRRQDANFPGANKILSQLHPDGSHITNRRVGLIMCQNKKIPPPRADVEIYFQDKLVGHVTSGCPSPSLGKNIAMGYIAKECKNPDTFVQLKIRGILYDARVTRMPFVKTNYYINPNKLRR